MVQSLAQTVAGLSSQVQQLSTQRVTPSSSGVSQPASGLSREALYTELFEFEERKKRRASVVIRGTKAKTVNELRSVFSNLCTNLTGSPYDPDDVHCINRDTGMFRVKVADLSVRDELILNAPKLKDLHQYKHIFISRDLTYNQRQEQRARRASRRNQDNNPRSPADTHSGSTPVISGANTIPLGGPPSTDSTTAAPTPLGGSLPVGSSAVPGGGAPPSQDL